MGINMNACEICSAIHNLDRHHLIPKRMGGRKEPEVPNESNLITLCRRCHQNFHNGQWELVRSSDGVWVNDKHTGVQVMRRLSNPSLDVPAMFQILNSAQDSLSRLSEFFTYLSDEQLVEAFAYASSFGKRAWLIRASILYEAQQRSTYGDNAVESIAKTFGISRGQAWKYALVWKEFFAGRDSLEESLNVETFSFEEPSWYVVAATETNDPGKWLS